MPPSSGLLTCQLAVTVGVTAAFMFNPPVKDYVLANPWALWTPLVMSLVLVLFMAFSESARRTHPWNLLLLGAFTICESVMVATISATIGGYWKYQTFTPVSQQVNTLFNCSVALVISMSVKCKCFGRSQMQSVSGLCHELNA